MKLFGDNALSDSAVLFELSWRRKVARIAGGFLLISLFLARVGLFQEMHKPAFPLHPGTTTSQVFTAGDVSFFGYPALEAISFMLVIPGLALLAIWIFYRCPRCGYHLLRSASTPDKSCVVCFAPLQEQVSRLSTLEDDGQNLREKYRSAKRVAWKADVGLVGGLVILGLFSQRPSGDGLGKELIILMGLFIIGGLFLIKSFLGRCPWCRRLLGIGFGRFNGSRPCSLEQR